MAKPRIERAAAAEPPGAALEDPRQGVDEAKRSRTTTCRPSTAASMSSREQPRRRSPLRAAGSVTRGSRGHLPGALEVRPRPPRRPSRQARPVIGRDEESRVSGAFAPYENNPVLIGEPGTGKTAIVEASRSASSPDAGGLSASACGRSTWRSALGWKYRGEREAEGRPERDHERRGRADPLHRRAAHDRGLAPPRRGRRRKHAEADARAR